MTWRRLGKKELTQAIARYARRHGYYARTVRAVSELHLAARREWLEKEQG
jgi:hypothetical protein